MRVLLYQNVPRKLRLLLRSHLVMTARQMGWDELVNGNLMRAAEEAGFEVLITADRSIFYQQNNQKRKIALVVLTGQREEDVLRHATDVESAIASAESRSYAVVQITRLPRGSKTGNV